jgi:hypothetical protein
LKSGYGHTAVVGGVVAVGLVLAVLSFAGGSSDNTDQDTSEMVLAAAVGPMTQIVAPPPVLATTTTLVGAAVPAANRDHFCSLASDFSAARRVAYDSSGQDRQANWQRQLEFFSIAATLVAPAAIDSSTGISWRDTLLMASDRQNAMNLELASVGWDLGAYHETSSSNLVEVPALLIVDVCGFDPRG